MVDLILQFTIATLVGLILIVILFPIIVWIID